MTGDALGFDPEQVDLALLVMAVSRRLGSAPARGFVVGRTVLRDAVARELPCSAFEAERLVDTLIERGFFRFERRDDEPGTWVPVVPGFPYGSSPGAG